jgi:hypothetical protein
MEIIIFKILAYQEDLFLGDYSTEMYHCEILEERKPSMSRAYVYV